MQLLSEEVINAFIHIRVNIHVIYSCSIIQRQHIGVEDAAGLGSCRGGEVDADAFLAACSFLGDGIATHHETPWFVVEEAFGSYKHIVAHDVEVACIALVAPV